MITEKKHYILINKMFNQNYLENCILLGAGSYLSLREPAQAQYARHSPFSLQGLDLTQPQHNVANPLKRNCPSMPQVWGRCASRRCYRRSLPRRKECTHLCPNYSRRFFESVICDMTLGASTLNRRWNGGLLCVTQTSCCVIVFAPALHTSDSLWAVPPNGVEALGVSAAFVSNTWIRNQDTLVGEWAMRGQTDKLMHNRLRCKYFRDK